MKTMDIRIKITADITKDIDGFRESLVLRKRTISFSSLNLVLTTIVKDKYDIL